MLKIQNLSSHTLMVVLIVGVFGVSACSKSTLPSPSPIVTGYSTSFLSANVFNESIVDSAHPGLCSDIFNATSDKLKLLNASLSATQSIRTNLNCDQLTAFKTGSTVGYIFEKYIGSASPNAGIVQVNFYASSNFTHSDGSVSGFKDVQSLCSFHVSGTPGLQQIAERSLSLLSEDGFKTAMAVPQFVLSTNILGNISANPGSTVLFSISVSPVGTTPSQYQLSWTDSGLGGSVTHCSVTPVGGVVTDTSGNATCTYEVPQIPSQVGRNSIVFSYIDSNQNLYNSDISIIVVQEATPAQTSVLSATVPSVNSAPGGSYSVSNLAWGNGNLSNTTLMLVTDAVNDLQFSLKLSSPAIISAPQGFYLDSNCGSSTPGSGYSAPDAVGLFLGESQIDFVPSAVSKLDSTDYAVGIAVNEGVLATNPGAAPIAYSNFQLSTPVRVLNADGSQSTRCINLTPLISLQYTVTATTDGNETVDPVSTQVVSSGPPQTFHVTPAPGYMLSATVGGSCPHPTDGTTGWDAAGNHYTTGVITQSCSVVFSATQIVYQVLASGDNHETLSNSGQTFVNWGQSQIFNVQAGAGYVVNPSVGGSCPQMAVDLNWVTTGWNAARTQYTTGAISGPCTVSFSATINSYQVTPAGDANVAIYLPSGVTSVNYGQTLNFNVTANSGFVMSPTVTATGGLPLCPQQPVDATGVTTSWNAARNQYITAPITGNCSVKFVTTPVYMVTPHGDGHVTIAGGFTQYVPSGQTATFSVSPNSAGYVLDPAVTVTGCPSGSWNAAGTQYTTGVVTSACSVLFSSIPTYQVTITGDGHETFSPSGAQTVISGHTQTTIVTPLPGYTLNAPGVGPSGVGCGGGIVSVSGSSYTYTTSAITANCSESFTTSVSTYTVIATAGAVSPSHEAIASSIQTNKTYGQTASFVVTSDSGYAVSPIVGGNCPAGSWAGNTYTTGPLVGNCMVSLNSVIPKKIFLSTNTYTGNLINGHANGVAGADAYCQADPKTTADNITTAKALLVDGTNRVACTSANCANGGLTENVNWVLVANMPYVRADSGVLIGATNSNGIFTFPLNQPFIATVAGQYLQAWTGISSSWNVLSTCNHWSSTSSTGTRGEVDGLYDYLRSSNEVEFGTLNCGSYNLPLLCVEQ